MQVVNRDKVDLALFIDLLTQSSICTMVPSLLNHAIIILNTFAPINSPRLDFKSHLNRYSTRRTISASITSHADNGPLGVYSRKRCQSIKHDNFRGHDSRFSNTQTWLRWSDSKE